MVQDIEFGGYQFELTELQDSPVLRFQMPYQIDTDWLSYQSRLIRHAYGPSKDVLGAVIDALSPWQVLSKLWAAKLLDCLLCSGAYFPRNVVHVGSWFGQLPVLWSALHMAEPAFGHLTHHLVDKNSTTNWIANDICQDHKTFRFNCTPIEHFPIAETQNALVTWPGIEHFDPDVIQAVIDRAPSSTIWMLMGTDLVHEDHGNPIRGCDDLLRYFHDATTLYRGELRSAMLGNRYMVICVQ